VTREELTALRDAIDMTLALPDSVRELLAQWLAWRLRGPMATTVMPLCPCRHERPRPKRALASRPQRKRPNGSSCGPCGTILASA
jgi:hypothetical protein